MKSKAWQITNATLVGKDRIQKSEGFTLKDGNLERPQTQAGAPELFNLNLHGLPVFPALINGYDALAFTYHALPETTRPHLNWLEWDNRLKASVLLQEKLLLDSERLYQLGAYRNLLSGVGTVVDFAPHAVRRPHLDRLPVQLLPDYGLSHSICSYAPDWGDPQQEYEKARSQNLPYITGIAAGFDTESRQSLQTLADVGALGANTVMLHGLALSETDLDQIAAAGAHLVWSPGSDLRLYQKTLPIKAALERGINVCLGTDHAMTGSNNLFEAIKVAARYYYEEYQEKLPETLLLKMVTCNAAQAFQLSDRGELRAGKRADLLVLKGRYPKNPLQALLAAQLADVHLVVCNGRPVYGDLALESLFITMGVICDRIQVAGIPKLVTRGMKNMLDIVQKITGVTKGFAFLPVKIGL